MVPTFWDLICDWSVFNYVIALLFNVGYSCDMERTDLVPAVPRPDLVAHERSIRTPFPEVVDALVNLLGARLVAYLGGVKETRAVRQWADGFRQPNEETQKRLRLAFHVAKMISEADGPAVTQAWFQGLNPQLDDRSPARLVRDGEIAEVGPLVLAAARAFRVGG